MNNFESKVDNELTRANDKHGPFPSAKVGFGRLLCEVVELGVEVLLTGDKEKARVECIQVAAMAKKLYNKL